MVVHKPGSRRVEAGFTLVEILIVVAIIGTISAIAIPALRAALMQTKATQAFANLMLIKQTLLEYQAETGELPANASGYGLVPPTLSARLSGNPFEGSGYVVMYTREFSQVTQRWKVLLFVRPRSEPDRPVLAALVRMMRRAPHTNGRSLFIYPDTDL